MERKDRIKDQTTTTGTGEVTLDGVAPTGFLVFTGNVTDDSTIRYLIENADRSEWEVGEGVYDDTDDTLTRVTVFASSNSGSLVDFSAGTKTVSLVMTAKDIYGAENIETPYKIEVTVASGNITVALKHLDGSDPSTSKPIRKKIGDTLREITASLSVTKNGGTIWCNAGSAELAAKEIDYFVYLGYNATDGVVIGFSRIPHACSYDDFSTTTTNEKYCAISTIANASATDYYENIGRFAATLAGVTVIDTYASSNINNNFGCSAGGSTKKAGQTFACSADAVLSTITLYGNNKVGSPSGNAYVAVYAHTGTYGTNGVPTGDALAISDPINENAILTGSNQANVFTFSGANRISLSNGTKYCLVYVPSTTGDDSNRILWGSREGGNVHGGNYIYTTDGSTWQVSTAADVCFVVGTGYSWSVPTFTAKNLRQTPIYISRKLAYAPAVSSEGGAPTTVTVANAYYQISMNRVKLISQTTITNKGTATGTLRQTTPFSKDGDNYCGGIVDGVYTGKNGSIIFGTDSRIDFRLYDATTPFLNNSIWTAEINYQI